MTKKESEFRMQRKSFPIEELGSDFFDPVMAGEFQILKVRFQNTSLAKKINISTNEPSWMAHFGKFQPLEDNLKEPLAMRYHGHQFHHYNPELGDGRGFLYAQFLFDQNLFELGTKGSGTTPYSRRGDGRLTLKGAVREALCTAYLQFQSVNTSKTFSIIETKENLIRHDEPSPTRSAILFRYSHGHIRIGNFQRQLFYQNPENIKKLTSYCLKYFYPFASSSQSKEEMLLENATFRLADLAASYMVSGFVHGVLNTDNINISGESFDYGPYRFLPHFDPHFTAAYFDTHGLYCFGRQPSSFLWNLKQLQKCLVYSNGDLKWDLELEFGKNFQFHLVRRFLRKLHLKPKQLSAHFQEFLKDPLSLEKNNFIFHENSQFPFSPDTEKRESLITSEEFNKAQKLVEFFFQWVESHPECGYEEAFFYLSSLQLSVENEITKKWQDTFSTSKEFNNLQTFISQHFENAEKNEDLKNYLKLSAPETMLINEIESIWEQIDSNDNWQLFENKIQRLERLNSVYRF